LDADHYLGAGRVVVPDGFRMLPDAAVLEALREVPVKDSDVLSRESFGTLPLDPDPVRALVGVVNTGMLDDEGVRDLLTAAANPPDKLGDIPEPLDPLGLRVRAATVAAMGADPLRGRVEEEPGRWFDATLDLWKLGVLRIPVEVL